MIKVQNYFMIFEFLVPVHKNIKISFTNLKYVVGFEILSGCNNPSYNTPRVETLAGIAWMEEG